VKTSIDLPIRRDVPRADQCSHGKKWDEVCPQCRIVALRESLAWMEPQVRRDRAELDSLTAGKSK
jgi:hypothetical protein